MFWLIQFDPTSEDIDPLAVLAREQGSVPAYTDTERKSFSWKSSVREICMESVQSAFFPEAVLLIPQIHQDCWNKGTVIFYCRRISSLFVSTVFGGFSGQPYLNKQEFLLWWELEISKQQLLGDALLWLIKHKKKWHQLTVTPGKLIYPHIT